jgi:LmbE family N-acetylglucosaminyl deacetylase
MLEFSLVSNLDRPLRVIALGAHADDIELGCGATILQLVSRYPDTEFLWAIASAEGNRAHEACASVEGFTKGIARTPDLVIGGFRDGYLPFGGTAVKEWVHTLGDRLSADVVFTHARDDLHQDHRFISELALNAFRDQPILEFEIPKYDGDLGAPNTFVPVEAELARRKCGLLVEHYESQLGKPWFNDDVFLGLMRIRGMESRSPSGYAEAFYCRKFALAI